MGNSVVKSDHAEGPSYLVGKIRFPPARHEERVVDRTPHCDPPGGKTVLECATEAKLLPLSKEA